MRTALLSALLLLVVSSSHAQLLQGRITGEKQQPLEAVSVNLLRAADTVWLATALTDSAGHYAFGKVPQGNYILEAALVGYAAERKPVTVVAGTARLDLQLKPEAHRLHEVMVSSRKPLIEAKPGMMVVNVEGRPDAAGNSAMDLLEKSPGVRVDPQGAVSLQGKSVQVLIDGKPTNLSGDQLAAYLKGMSSEEIAALELITQPSAKYDAAGSGGIINIKTRKSRKNGVSGSLQASYAQAVYPGATTSEQITWRKNKVTLFASHFYRYSESFFNQYISRNFREGAGPDVTSNVLWQTTEHYTGDFHRFRAGMEYAFSDRTTASLGFRLPTGINTTNALAQTTTTDFVQPSSGQSLTQTDGENHWNEKQADLSLKHTFRDKSEWTLDGFYVVNAAQQVQQQQIGSSNYHNEYPSATDLLSVQTDYSHDLSAKLKLEAGLKYSDVAIDNIAHSSLLQNGGYVPDTGRSSHLRYGEHINAAYATMTAVPNKQWSIQAGLRAEQTSNHGRLPGTGVTFGRSYVSAFPTLFVQYKPGDKHSFSLTAGRRIDRPDYSQLNPARYYQDAYTYSTGNPYLRPQYTTSAELGYSYKGQLNVTIAGSHTGSIISDVQVQNDSSMQNYWSYGNIAQYNQASAIVNYNAAIRKWWTVALYGDVYYKHYEGVYNNEPIDQDGFTCTLNANNQFRLGKHWNAELGGWYDGPGIESAVARVHSSGSVHAAIARQFLQDTLTVKLNVQNVFATLAYNAETRYAGIDNTTHSDWDSRRCTLSLAYNFGRQIDLMQHKNEGGTGRAD